VSSERVAQRFAEAAALHAAMGAQAGEIAGVAEVIAAALRAGRKVLVFGNGGSATDAQHLSSELVGRFERDRRAAAVVALTTDGALMTAVGNDYGFDRVFARQIEALGAKGDVAFAITTSGTSANVNLALERAKALGMTSIALTGRDGGETGRLADRHLNVRADNTARIQEVHRTILHVLCELIEETL
jgi:D-sedoheptulose 7-phosphate isomerase